MNPEKVSIYAVGDLVPDRPNPESLLNWHYLPSSRPTFALAI